MIPDGLWTLGVAGPVMGFTFSSGSVGGYLAFPCAASFTSPNLMYKAYVLSAFPDGRIVLHAHVYQVGGDDPLEDAYFLGASSDGSGTVLLSEDGTLSFPCDVVRGSTIEGDERDVSVEIDATSQGGNIPSGVYELTFGEVLAANGREYSAPPFNDTDELRVEIP